MDASNILAHTNPAQMENQNCECEYVLVDHKRI